MNQEKLKSTIKQARSISLQYYQLIIFNIALINGLYVKEFSLVYLVGSFILALLSITILSYTVLKFIKVQQNDQIKLINDETKQDIQELFLKLKSLFNQQILSIDNQQKNTGFIKMLVLLFIGLTFIPFWVQMLLLCNFLFMWVFMKQVVLDLINLCNDILSGLLNKIPKFTNSK